jgi:hypothetical protein
VLSFSFESENKEGEAVQIIQKQNISLEEDKKTTINDKKHQTNISDILTDSNSLNTESVQLIDPEEYADLPKVDLQIPDSNSIEDPIEWLEETAKESNDKLLEKYGSGIFDGDYMGDLEYYFDLSVEQEAEIRSGYTLNYDPRIELPDYTVRSDLFIPVYNESTSDNAIFPDALEGYRADKIEISIHDGLTEYDILDIANQIQSNIDSPITVTDIYELRRENKNTKLRGMSIVIHYSQLPTSQEIEYVKKQIENLSYVRSTSLEREILPEYDQIKYINLLRNSEHKEEY